MLYGSVLMAHAGAMIAAFMLFVAGELLWIPARWGRVRPARFALHFRRAGGALATVGVLSGITLLLLGGWSPAASWLIASLVLVAALMAVERILIQPWERRARALFRDDPSAAEVAALAGATHALLGRLAMLALFLLVATLMVAKPPFPFLSA